MSSLLAALSQAGSQATNDAQMAGKNATAKSDMLKAIPRNTAPSVPSGEPLQSKPAKADMVNSGAKARFGSRPGEQRLDVSGAIKPLGSFKKGGKVKKTGVYKLHKGERVLNRRQTAQMDMASKSGAWHALSGMDEQGSSEGYDKDE